MRRIKHTSGKLIPVILATLCVPGVRADEMVAMSSSTRSSDVWQQTVDLVSSGQFEEATASLRGVADKHALTGKVLKWLEAYEAKQAERRRANREDFEKYVRYAKERIDREEYLEALDWAIMCRDVAADKDEFIRTDWLHDLTNKALEEADKLREKEDWLGAWRIYNDLGMIFEREPRYEKLQREAQTHYRLNVMFEKDSHWEEFVENVRWEDARASLDEIGLHYVTPADFKAMCETGLEQLVLLAESESAQKAFPGLANAENRREFIARLQAKLDQVRMDPSVDRRECIEHFRRVVTKLNVQTVEIPEQLLVSEMMRGAFTPLDDYTTIIWPSDIDEFQKQTDGEFVGVGISIIKNRSTDEIEVVTPLEDSPAYRAGVQAGDIITLVDGEPIEGFTLNRVVKTITGKPGTEVTLTVRRADDSIEFPLTRERIKIHSVKGVSRDESNPEQWDHWIDKDHGIAYVRITNFQRNTAEDLENVLSRLEAEGINGLILDLRGNPGGLLDSAWRISTLFLHAGDTVVKTKGRHRAENQSFKAPTDGAFSDIPVTVLTDESSASASEIVAGAIRDNNIGLVVGARTFGKFSVQNLLPLGQSNAKLKLTTAHYYLPSGVSLHRNPDSEKWGVEPNVPISLVRKEKLNILKLRRDSELLGVRPDDEGNDAAADATDKSDETDKDAKANPEADADSDDKSEKTAKGDKEEESKLPPIEQPDENNRPKADPQLESALLVTKIRLLAEKFPTLATAQAKPAEEVARP